MTDLYPNADREGRPRPDVSRRTLLAGSAAVGTAVTAGCLGDDSDPESGVENRPSVFVFNTGDGTVSVVDVETDTVVATHAIGMTASFPSNQFAPRLTDAPSESLWLNVDDGVRALAVGTLSERTHVETGSGANWQERTPDGAALLVSAREPAHRQLKIDADPDSETFGDVTAELDRADEGGRGDNEGPGPCDVTVHPDGAYAYVPDLFGDTLTVLDVDAFEIARQVAVSERDGLAPAPWMGTASWDGQWLLVEHSDGDEGSESLWDVSDPADPLEVARLTTDDGMGVGPLTSEIGPDSRWGYVFTPGSEDVTVVDIENGTVADRLDLGGSAFVGSWGPDRTKLYVPVRSSDEVAVVDADSRTIVDRLDVGAAPYGATAATVRPDPERTDETTARVERLTGEYETAYCIGACACGHELER